MAVPVTIARFPDPIRIDPEAVESANLLIESAPQFLKHPREIAAWIPDKARSYSPNDPRIVGIGNHAVTFDLSTRIPTVIKMIGHTHFEGRLLLTGRPASRLPGAIEESVQSLRELLPRDVVVPCQFEHRAETGEYFHLAPHLSADPTSRLFEVVRGGEALQDLSYMRNGSELQGLIDESTKILMSHYMNKDGEYRSYINGHLYDCTPELVFMKMFFIRANSNGYGTLYAGDLDHAFIQKTERRNAFLDSLGF